MDLNEYQERTKETAVYPAGERKGYYPILALCGEAGELANVFKKMIRTGAPDNDPVYLAQLMDELGDVLWYTARIAEDFGFNLNNVAKFNLKKLRLRKVTGRLKEGEKK